MTKLRNLRFAAGGPLIAAFLAVATACGSGSVPFNPLPGNEVPSAQEMLNRINEHRGSVGVATVVSDVDLRTIAQEQANYQAQQKSIGHIDAEGGRVAERAAGVGYTYLSIGEIVGFADSGQQMFSNWLASAGHRSIIESQQYTEVGVGVATSLGVQYWCVVFANPR